MTRRGAQKFIASIRSGVRKLIGSTTGGGYVSCQVKEKTIVTTCRGDGMDLSKTSILEENTQNTKIGTLYITTYLRILIYCADPVHLDEIHLNFDWGSARPVSLKTDVM